MIRESLIQAATRLHIDDSLVRARAVLFARDRGYLEEHQRLSTILSSALTPTSNCIDIGAFRGRALAHMVQLAPGGHHIAYEPQPHLYRLLVRRFPTVDVRQAAVSSAPGETTFTVVADAPGLSGFRDRWHDDSEHRTESLTVRVETLDSDLPLGYVPDLIKVDVEGAERLVFEGAINTIAKHRPTIIFEHGQGGADHYETEPADIYRLLALEGGLRIFDLDGHGPYTLAEFEDAYQLNERWDFLARR